MFLFSFLSHFKCYPWTGGSLSAGLQPEQEAEDAGTEVQQQQLQAALEPQHHRKGPHTPLVSLTHTLTQRLHCSHTQTYLHGTDWHMRRGFSFNGSFGMHVVAKSRLRCLHRSPSVEEVKWTKEQDHIPESVLTPAERERYAQESAQHLGKRRSDSLLTFCMWRSLVYTQIFVSE